MAPKDDDTLPDSYKYAWTCDSGISVEDFLSKYKPSMVQNDGTKPWIWVQGSTPPRSGAQIEEAIEEASQLLKEVTEKVESIKNDETIPIRSSKKTGAKSKKEVREQVQAEATEKLKEIALKHDYVCGKWLIFAPADKVDIIWSSIAMSLVSGPLHSTPAFLAKVSTSPQDENSKGPHIICVYLPNIFDKTQVTEVMKTLLRSHGATLSGAKSDLYTMIGIDSKHPSGIPSTVWKNAAVLPEKEIQELRDAYFSQLVTKTVPAANIVLEKGSDAKDILEPRNAKAPTRFKRKQENSDPFGSEDDEDATVKEKAQVKETIHSQAEPSKVKAKPKLKKKVHDPFGSDEEDEGVKKPSSTAENKRTQTENDEEPPKKKRAVKK